MNNAAKPRILLVEDERIVRELVMRILRMDGYSVLEAADPDEALVLCRNHAGRIHLTLSDVMMPTWKAIRVPCSRR